MIDKDLIKMPPNVVGYNKKNIPLYISTEKLSDHLNSHTMPHWHEDLEFLEILDGNMQIKINNEKFQSTEIFKKSYVCSWSNGSYDRSSSIKHNKS